MYSPYLRGKQYELILLRENAQLLRDSQFLPIIEPVKSKNPRGLARAANALIDVECPFILISNPIHGDFKNNHSDILSGEMHDVAEKYPELCIVGVIAAENTSTEELKELLGKGHNSKAIIHYGYTKPKLLRLVLSQYNVSSHVFIDEHSPESYRSFFSDADFKILIKDGFKKRVNREYPPKELFSDTHLEYTSKGMNGFGDFTIVSDDYSESGGPALAVAIHLTDFESQEDIETDPEYLAELEKLGDDANLPELVNPKSMIIRHFISDSNDTIADPGGKFLEALEKAVSAINQGTFAYRTKACDELLALHSKQHYPGLGYVKKLSMQHHIELMAHYCDSL